ncbi:MAG: hypothetical protein FMNOHCHN_01297 [Ignavibacteriaceae bacterium]|nr:hypothetical protein [Ignavibacteriaceae bacterium]
MILKTDCIHFPGDRPCRFNKETGQECTDCPYYISPSGRILIIKLDAVGDVLRSTSILPALHRKYPGYEITWVTRQNAADLFRNNPLVHHVAVFEKPETLMKVMNEEYDILIHPDSNPASGSMASLVNAKKKFGFITDSQGNVSPMNEAASGWLEMGAFDKRKKENRRSYQEILHDICELEYKRDEIQLSLSKNEKEFRDAFKQKHNLSRFNKIIGLNTGASARWRLKQWHQHHLETLISSFKDQSEAGILLYGGPEERERNKSLKEKFPFVIDTGTENSLRQFFSLLDISDIILTGDTLGLHAATALKKEVICLFGPTSSAEIEDYGRITKVVPDMECLVCYKPECDFKPNCMDLIFPATVESVIRNKLKS